MNLFCSDRPRAAALRFVALAATTLLAACGGGGGDAGGAPVADLQGFYAGSFGADTAQAIVLPDGVLWLVVQSGGAIQSAGRGQAGLAGSSARISGVVTDLASGTSSALSLDVPAFAARSTLAGSLRAGPKQANIRWAYDSRYETPRPVADFAGRWEGTASQGRVALTWDIAASGVVQGTSTTGCTYNGRLTAQAPATAVLGATVTERCPGLANLTLSGIATLNAAGDRASLVLAPPAGTSAAFLALEK